MLCISCLPTPTAAAAAAQPNDRSDGLHWQRRQKTFKCCACREGTGLQMTAWSGELPQNYGQPFAGISKQTYKIPERQVTRTYGVA